MNRCCRYYSHLFQPKISRFWSWVVVFWLFLSLWFGGYVNFVEIFGFVIVGFGGFGGFQWQWVCECLLRWVETLRLSVVGGC